MNKHIAARPATRWVALCLATVSMWGSPLLGRAQAPRDVNPLAAAQADFQKRLKDYLALRADLADRTTKLSPTSSAAELSNRQTALAGAIREARKSAKPGDLIPPGVAAHITKVVGTDFHLRQPTVKSASLGEVPRAVRPTVNGTYPADAPLPTMPPLLLEKLPRLPDNLQYRFYGRHVVLLDGDTQLIIDYVANALPPS